MSRWQDNRFYLRGADTIMKQPFHWTLAIVFTVFAAVGPAEAAPVRVLDAGGIHAASIEGVAGLEPGEYAVWVWSRDASPLTVEIASTALQIEADPDAAPDRYSWKKAGSVTLGEAESVPLDIYNRQRTMVLEPESVGRLALASVPDWNPERIGVYAEVFPNSAKRVEDARAGVVRSIPKYYHFPEFASKREWLERKMELEDHILVSMGLYPFPEKTPLNTNVFGKIERDDYTVEKAHFESYPGLFVTGNLYRPKGKTGPFPGIVSPHGHWSEGRLANVELGSVPGRAISLARQGHVVFTCDMIGYVDSQQLGHDFGGEREWLWGINLHGLQTWNAIRAVDFLLELEDVDPERIGCTGASGGGTQTFFLTAVDGRVKVSAPVNMLSAHFQGGCLCENAPNLRINAFNLEYGAMMAPRPLLMVSATGDWTDETPWVEYPAIRSVYGLFDAEERIGVFQADAPHNYNKESREAVYAWFGKWFLDDGNPTNFEEKPFEVEPESDLRVFPEGMPDAAVSAEELSRYLQRQSEEQLQSAYPNSEYGLRKLRRVYRTALKHALGAEQPGHNELTVERVDRVKQPDLFIEKVIIGREGEGDRIPGVLLIPRSGPSIKPGAVLAHGEGKAAWMDGGYSEPGPVLRALLDGGWIVFMPDLFLTGEHHSPFGETVRDTNASHFLTYNQTTAALRVQDILTSIAFMNSLDGVEKTNLIAAGGAGPLSVLAAALSEDLNSLIADANRFATGRDAAYLEDLFVPGLRRAGDFRAAQALLAPMPLFVHNKGRAFHTAWAADAYGTAGASAVLEIIENTADLDTMTRWLNDMQ